MITRLLLLAMLLGLPLSAAAQSAGPEAGQRVIIPAAAKVDLAHLGTHTHENVIRFDIGSLDLTRGPSPHLVAHCRLGTDHAALPPGLEALAPDVGPVPTSGPIEHWGMALDRQNGHFGVRVLVPTRFANWVAAQTPALRRRYLSLHSYTLEIDWPK